MQPDISQLHGLVFCHPETSEEYGLIRPLGGENDPQARQPGWLPFAQDEGGNAFVVSPNGSVGFWDHETDDVTELAPSWSAFVSSCQPPSEVELDPSQVRSVWIDPAFAKEHGIEVDEDGWRKKP